MIVYNKLGDYLKKNGLLWKDLQTAIGIAPGIMAKFQKNRPCNTDTINKICEYLKVQPGEIMEWVADEEYERQNSERLAIEAKIAELQSQLKAMK